MVGPPLIHDVSACHKVDSDMFSVMQRALAMAEFWPIELSGHGARY